MKPVWGPHRKTHFSGTERGNCTHVSNWEAGLGSSVSQALRIQGQEQRESSVHLPQWQLSKKVGNSLNQEDEYFLTAWPGQVQKKESEAGPPSVPRGMANKASEIFLPMRPYPSLYFMGFFLFFSFLCYTVLFFKGQACAPLQGLHRWWSKGGGETPSSHGAALKRKRRRLNAQDLWNRSGEPGRWWRPLWSEAVPLPFCSWVHLDDPSSLLPPCGWNAWFSTSRTLWLWFMIWSLLSWWTLFIESLLCVQNHAGIWGRIQSRLRHTAVWKYNMFICTFLPCLG